MGKTIRHEQRRNLFKNGERGHHNTLLREYYKMNTGVIKDWRELLILCDYESDRLKTDRNIMTKLCRTRSKRYWKNEVKNQLNEE